MYEAARPKNNSGPEWRPEGHSTEWGRTIRMFGAIVERLRYIV